METSFWQQSDKFSKGDILRASDNSRDKGYHPIIYIQGDTQENFIGAMITHRARYKSVTNIKMGDVHFENLNDTCKSFMVVNDDSYLVPRQFKKPESWGNFKRIGRLTDEGITFVESYINEYPPEFFADYEAKLDN